MDKRVPILLEIILIVLLLSSCAVIEYRNISFKRDCIEVYDINKSCPCRQVKFEPTNWSIIFKNLSNNNSNN